MKYSTLISARSIFESRSEEAIPAVTAYKFMKILSDTFFASEQYATEVNKILDEYAEKTSDGNFITGDGGGVKIKEGMSEECKNKITELNDREIFFNTIYLTLQDLAPLKFTVKEMAAIIPFIKEG